MKDDDKVVTTVGCAIVIAWIFGVLVSAGLSIWLIVAIIQWLNRH